MAHGAAASGEQAGAGWSFLLAAILLAYLIVGALYAIETPPWQAPDEPAHYNYIRQLAGGVLPVIEPGDYDERYRSEAVSSRFAAAFPIEPLTYEDWQPPLYYLLLTPLFALFGGALLPLRLTSLALGVGIILAAHGVAAVVWPGKPWLTATAAAFVAFLPQHIAILASVNNDSLAWLIIALILWTLARVGLSYRHRRPLRWRWWLGIGLLLGLGLITKLTVYIMAPLIFIAICAVYWRQWPAFRRALLLVALPAALLALPWWARNMVVYGMLDPLAIGAHDAVVLGQPRTAEWLGLYGPIETLQRFITTTFRSFWGQFGWMGVLMDQRIYWLLLLFTVAVALGLVWRYARPPHPTSERHSLKDRDFLPWLFLAAVMLNVLLYLGYNLSYVQHQGRYLFASLVPIAIGVAAGTEPWANVLARIMPHPRALAPLLFAAALMALDLLALYRYIVPQLSLP